MFQFESWGSYAFTRLFELCLFILIVLALMLLIHTYARCRDWFLVVVDVVPDEVWLIVAVLIAAASYLHPSFVFWWCIPFAIVGLFGWYQDRKLEDDADPEYNTPPRGWRR